MNDQPVFIDTNVWLYAFIRVQDPLKHSIARRIVQSSSILVSTQVVNEVCVNLVRKAHVDESFIQSLITSFYRRYTVLSFDAPVLLKASDLRTRYKVSFWDSLIIASALQGGASMLYSEDMQDGLLVDNQLEIVNPFVRGIP